MQANNNPSDPALHKRVTNPDKEEYEPVVENLGKDCAKIYAQLEVRETSQAAPSL
jgi:hypothetical protein